MDINDNSRKVKYKYCKWKNIYIQVLFYWNYIGFWTLFFFKRN